MPTLLIIMLGVVLNATAQLSLKAGTQSFGALDISLASLKTAFWPLLFNPFILLGLSCYVVSVGLWIVALSRVEVSYAYPLASLGYVINAIGAYYLFEEPLSPLRLTGIGIILIGVYCLSRSAA